MKTFTKFTLILFAIAVGLRAADRFDTLVRGDFFAGFAGNTAALNRAMKTCDDALAANPNNAEALVWHGSGNLFLGGQAFRTGDSATGGRLWQLGLQEMRTASELQPENPAVLIPRGATLLAISSVASPPPQSRLLLEQGVADYAKVRELQKTYFDTLSGHARGELLFGLGDGYRRLDRQAEARETFEALLRVGDKSGHQEQATRFLKGELYEKSAMSCTGCHNRK